MIRLFIILLSIAAITVACTKEEVTYIQSHEIGIIPVPESLTKGALVPNAGESVAVLPDSHEMGIFAYRKSDEEPGSDPDYENREVYLNDATFSKKQILVDGKMIEGWGGAGATSYPWPLNGSLVFAGYNKPVGKNLEVSYDLENNIMIFSSYEQSSDKDETFDLCWFGRTPRSYNNRVTGESISLTLQHALSWITIKVIGEDNFVTDWTIEDIRLVNLVVKSTGTCTGPAANSNSPNGRPTFWLSPSPESTDDFSDMDLIENEKEWIKISNSSVICGGATANADPGIVVIPQKPVNLEVQYKRSDTSPLEKKEVSLKLNEENDLYWEAGKHYVYTLKFKANEILVAPSFGEWGNGTDQTIVVE